MVHAVLTRHCMFIQRQHVMAAAHGHGKGGRKKQGQHSPWGYVEDQAPRKVGPLASWGLGVPTPNCLSCLCAAYGGLPFGGRTWLLAVALRFVGPSVLRRCPECAVSPFLYST